MGALAFQIGGAGLLGAMCGLVGGVFGIGGGFIAIPLLGMFYGLDQQSAQGTTLLMVVPNVLLAFWHYRQRVGVDLRIATTLAITALVSTYPVARLATTMDPHALRLAFAAFLGTLGGVGVWRHLRVSGRTSARRPLAWGWSAAIGVGGGAASGLFGVGGAFVGAPALNTFLGVSQMAAQGLSLAIAAPGAVVALAAYAEAGEVDWLLGIPLAIGGTAAISTGVAVAHRLPERRLRLAFCGLLAVTAALLALHG